MNWKLIRIIDSLLGIPLIRMISMLLPDRNNGTPRPADVSPKKILLVKFWGIGNMFMLLPSIQVLQDTFPEAEIDFLTLESNREALQTLGVVNRITAIDTGSALSFLRTWKAAVNDLAAAGYDLAIDFEQFARFSALMTFQTGAARTIGFATRGQRRHALYSRAVEYDNHIHIAQSFYRLAAAAGADRPFSADIHLENLGMLRSKGEQLLRVHAIDRRGPLVVMHIGTSENFRERRWPPRHFAALADLLISRFGMRVVMTGLQDESFLIAETKRHVIHAGQVTDLGGHLSFTDYYALMTRADLVISADTAAVHIASALNIPVVGLYGPNTPLLYGPWRENGLALCAGLDCSPCITNFNSKINTCRHPEGRGACMKSLSVEEVFSAIETAYCAPDAPFRLAKFTGTEPEPCTV
jgi:heptosyltransferase III